MKIRNEYNARRIQETCLYMARDLRTMANLGVLPLNIGELQTTRVLRSTIEALTKKERAP